MQFEGFLCVPMPVPAVALFPAGHRQASCSVLQKSPRRPAVASAVSGAGRARRACLGGSWQCRVLGFGSLPDPGFSQSTSLMVEQTS